MSVFEIRASSLGRTLDSPRWRVALAVAIGLLNFFSLFGWGPFDPRNIDWIFGDNATYYAGWALYRQDPHLRFPLAWTDRIGFPVGTSIALMDAVPLAAIVLRPFGPLLPEPFQYLGLYSTLCLILQAYFALSLCRRLFPASPWFALAGSLLFQLSAPLTWRAFGHTALLGHWLILASLDGWFRPVGSSPTRWMTRLWVVLALAAGVTPYIAAMCLLIALAAIARLLVERRCRWVRAFAYAGTSGIVLVGTMVVVGVLIGSSGTTYRGGGYGQFSMNLNAPINPMEYGSLLLPALPVRGASQVEGYNYLGFGVLALLLLGVMLKPSAVAGLWRPRQRVLAGLAIVCVLLALSQTVTLGNVVVFEWTLPDAVIAALAGFRASGRFFWPVYYLLFLAALALTARAWPARAATVVVLLAVALQVADLHQLRSEVREATSHRFPSELHDPVWQGLGRRYSNLIILPAWQCSPSGNGGGYYSYVTFGKLAAREHMRTNSYYAARYSREQMAAHCLDLLRAQLDGDLDSDSAYLITDAVAVVWALRGVTSHVCRRADGYNLCTPAAQPASPAPIPPAAPYTLDTRLDLTSNGGHPEYLTIGWTPPAPAGTWTEGPISLVRLGLDPLPDPARSLLLTVEATAFVVPEHPRLWVDVVVNGQPIDRWTFRATSPATRREAKIPASVAASQHGLDIEFRPVNAESPLYLGTGPHPLFLGLNVRTLTVRYE